MHKTSLLVFFALLILAVAVAVALSSPEEPKEDAPTLEVAVITERLAFLNTNWIDPPSLVDVAISPEEAVDLIEGTAEVHGRKVKRSSKILVLLGNLGGGGHDGARLIYLISRSYKGCGFVSGPSRGQPQPSPTPGIPNCARLWTLDAHTGEAVDLQVPKPANVLEQQAIGDTC